LGADVAASNSAEKVMTNSKHPTADESATITAKCEAVGMVATGDYGDSSLIVRVHGD
jgi:hypothetical protein